MTSIRGDKTYRGPARAPLAKHRVELAPVNLDFVRLVDGASRVLHPGRGTPGHLRPAERNQYVTRSQGASAAGTGATSPVSPN